MKTKPIKETVNLKESIKKINELIDVVNEIYDRFEAAGKIVEEFKKEELKKGDRRGKKKE